LYRELGGLTGDEVRVRAKEVFDKFDDDGSGQMETAEVRDAAKLGCRLRPIFGV
jgi:Ca2+-binding EF-hand superfamily protein